ncbi:MAG: AraC family transcriptional regulator [Chryseobacterium sp.]|nr:MAG: AraC family transcriptional regulator [Chryseobacterium sp.]
MMETEILKPRNEILRNYVEYFLFLRKPDNKLLNYSTFPNANICLAIYRENHIDYNHLANNNDCIITEGNSFFSSRLYGFHKRPFNVNINSALDQICIIFHPSALRAFTHESYDDLMKSDNVFDIFKDKDDYVLESIFEEKDFARRAEQLEQILLKNLKFKVPDKMKEAFQLISKSKNDDLAIETLAKKLEISTPTLFRLFKNHLGQNPKSYLKTVRFRHALEEILHNNNSTLTNITFSSQFYDQSHFIHEIKSFSGYSPKQLSDKASIQQDALVWIYKNK